MVDVASILRYSIDTAITQRTKESNMQTQVLDTREVLKTAYKVVKQIAFGIAQCADYDSMKRKLLDVTTLEQGSVYYTSGGSIYSLCYILRKEGYEDLYVADWSGSRWGTVSVDVGCATQKGYKQWRALLRSY